MAYNARKIAVDIFLRLENQSAYINIEMNKLRMNKAIDAKDIGLVSELVNGTVKHKITLDYVIGIHSDIKVKKIAPFVLAVLRIGAYQKLYMDKIPESAAVNESVKIIKKSSVYRLSGFVNAVLRGVCISDIEKIDDNTPEGLSVKYSFPLWMVKRWVNRYGFSFTSEMLFSFNERPPFYIRCNPLNNDVDVLKNKLIAENVECESFKINGFNDFNYCLKINNSINLNNMDTFINGDFYIQDPAAALAAFLLKPEKNDVVIDMCSAPGGKSLFLSELMENSGKIYSFDIYEHKIKLIYDNCKKYGAENIYASVCDATVFNPEFENTADKIICDVPCSGFGIIRKKPDIKYARKEEDILSLADFSKKILSNAARYLKNGGVLVFSTCTIEPEENEDIAKWFLNSHFEFSPLPFETGNSMITFYPNTEATDGFFISRFKKNGEKRFD